MKILTIILALLFTITATAKPEIYTTDAGDNLEDIVQKKMKLDDLQDQDYAIIIFQLKRYNPNIQDWQHLKEGTRIFLTPPLTAAISNFRKAYLKKACEENKNIYQKERNNPNFIRCQQYLPN